MTNYKLDYITSYTMLANDWRVRDSPVSNVLSKAIVKIAAKGGCRDCGILNTHYAWPSTK